jgi:hypothetical protein
VLVDEHIRTRPTRRPIGVAIRPMSGRYTTDSTTAAAHRLPLTAQTHAQQQGGQREDGPPSHALSEEATTE